MAREGKKKSGVARRPRNLQHATPAKRPSGTGPKENRMEHMPVRPWVPALSRGYRPDEDESKLKEAIVSAALSRTIDRFRLRPLRTAQQCEDNAAILATAERLRSVPHLILT